MQIEMQKLGAGFNKIMITKDGDRSGGPEKMGVLWLVSAAKVENLRGVKNLFGLWPGRRQTKETERNGDQSGRAAAF